MTVNEVMTLEDLRSKQCLSEKVSIARQRRKSSQSQAYTRQRTYLFGAIIFCSKLSSIPAHDIYHTSSGESQQFAGYK